MKPPRPTEYTDDELLALLHEYKKGVTTVTLLRKIRERDPQCSRSGAEARLHRLVARGDVWAAADLKTNSLQYFARRRMTRVYPNAIAWSVDILSDGEYPHFESEESYDGNDTGSESKEAHQVSA